MNEIIYKFSSLAHAEIVIQSHSLKFTDPKQFNDPFDCSVKLIDSFLEFKYSPNSEKLQPIIRSLYNLNPAAFGEYDDYINRISNDPGFLEEMFRTAQYQKINDSSVCAFSILANNILLWSHYGDSHKGIALGFDYNVQPFFMGVPEENINADMVSYGYGDNRTNYLSDPDAGYKKVFFSKSYDWSYEKEFRIVILNDSGLIPFNPQALKKVVFGYRVTKFQKSGFIDLLERKQYTGVQFREVTNKGLNLIVRPYKLTE